ncbi:MAG TPA: hypothetical protein VMH28_10220 [Candidatus Acidoferrales bacterium]|nr:hypothetical protein [Candidatus Acidoferrales bacterium]
MSIAAAAAPAADKEPPPFKPGAASSFASHQTNAQVMIGVEAYDSGEKVKAAFGKLDPYQYGVLPVLVVIENNSEKTIRLDNLRAEYSGPNHDRVAATPARDIRYLKGPDRPNMIPGPAGKVKVLKPKKNPLDAWEIEGRAFAAKFLPPGQSASGFFYFQTGLQRNATIYLAGMTEAGTGKEIFYFELPL